jgi:serine/threonine protein kinase, bacterial
MALASGATFAGYTVARRLGKGVTGEVYLAQDPRSARWVALKVLSPALSSDGEFRRRFHAETALAAGLYHPHIVEVHDRGEFEGQLWVAMEYVEGLSAAQLMAERFPAVWPAGEVLAVVSCVAEALDHAHHRGLLHRDVKPANILLSGRDRGEQRILLTDFGIADTGAVGYAAPEQLTGAEIDGSADQHALAATAFHLLTGAPPAAADQWPDATPPRLVGQRPELAGLDDALSRALATAAADRFASCQEFADAVNEAAGVAVGDRSPEAFLAAEIFDYPAYAWLEAENAESTPPSKGGSLKRRGTALHSAAGALVRRLDDFASGGNVAATPPGLPTAAAEPRRPRPRVIALTCVAVLMAVALLAAGIVIGRGTQTKAPQAGGTATSAPSAPAAAVAPTSATPSAPVPLDGTYRVEVQRSKQTFNYIPDPQPPDVTTWWAFRSSCTPPGCTAAGGTLLDDDDRTRARPNESHLVLHFGEGQWLSDAEPVQFPCVGGNGSAHTQSTTQVLALRPQPHDNFVGELTVSVQTNECGQRGAVIRVPTVASRTGAVAPGVRVPEPGTAPSAPTATPAGPSTSPSGPGR